MKRRSVLALAAVLVLGGLGYGAWRSVTQRSAQFCRACTRTIHSHTKTVALVDGKRGFYCCPSCALSEHQQSGKPVEVIELADHLGGRPLSTQDSYVVRNSDLNPCLQHQPLVNADKQPMHSHFDRCAPGILAFRDRKSAMAFAAAHGGQVMRFAELTPEFRR